MTRRAKQERYFAGIPLRVWLDRRLTRRHIIVLGIIAAHDQFDANGQGCTASQRRIAELAGCYETHVSEMVRDLRDWEYITSELRGRQRVHRIVWKNAVDRCFWAPTRKTNTSHGREASEDDTYRTRDKHLQFGGSILTVFDQKIGTSDSVANDLGLRTESITESITYSAEADGSAVKSKNLNGVEDRTDCAKARNRDRTFVSIEEYLTACETTAVSGDPDHLLTFEHQRLAKIASDAALPAAMVNRARSLLTMPRPDFGNSPPC